METPLNDSNMIKINYGHYHHACLIHLTHFILTFKRTILH